MEVVGQDHRIHVVFNEGIKILVYGGVFSQVACRSCQTILVEIANGHDVAVE